MEDDTAPPAVKIAKLRKIIQLKCNAIKRNNEKREKYLDLMYEPITKLIRKRCNDSSDSSDPAKVRILSSPRQNLLPIPTMPYHRESANITAPSTTVADIPQVPANITTPISTSESIPIPVVASTSTGSNIEHQTAPSILKKLSVMLDTRKSPEPQSDTDYPSSYLTKLKNNQTDDLDLVYGVRFDKGRYLIGDTIVNFKDNSIEVGDNNYWGTNGLYELLFSKDPNSKVVVESDLRAYKEILKATNAHRKRYSSSGSLNENKNHPKYKNVISHLFKSKFVKKGAGEPSHVNPNHLVEQMKILVYDITKNHSQEIKRIEEKLREGGIIS